MIYCSAMNWKRAGGQAAAHAAATFWLKVAAWPIWGGLARRVKQL